MQHSRDTNPALYDVVVVGAGFSGLYMLHKLREFGFRVRGFEAATGVGGTWFWNRYPGARCDIDSFDYSYGFSEEVQQEWVWTETNASQPEIEAYLNFVADKLDLRRDITFGTKVVGLRYNESDFRWTLYTEAGEDFNSTFVVAATGCLSVPIEHRICDEEAFGGTTLFTNRFPAEGFDFAGKRVAVVGTGSSGVQVIPVLAEVASHLYVFQRSAAYTLPAFTRKISAEEVADVKATYADLRLRQKRHPAGAARPVGPVVPPPTRRIVDASAEELRSATMEYGWGVTRMWTDVLTNLDANDIAKQLYAELIRQVVDDPEVAASLVPTDLLGCKRQVYDNGYFTTFNRDNVTLVDLRKGGIEKVVATGIQTAQGTFEVDVIVYATGFDAMTGALRKIDVRGRGGLSLRELWEAKGPLTYLGLQVAGFPNLFLVTGPGSPSVLSNMVASIEQHVEWIADCLVYLRDGGYRSIEATEEAQDKWVDHVATQVEGRVSAEQSCASWYLGANVPGKKRVFMPYAGGLHVYREKCDDVVTGGYQGFALDA